MAANWGKLTKAWYKDFLPSSGEAMASSQKIYQAIEKTIPLLHDNVASVPFVCRYRTDIIDPLSTKQVQTLSEYILKHSSLETLRKKVIQHINKTDEELLFRVETTISKVELEDIYAPFKPPSKGSLEDRILSSHPELVEAVDELWEKGRTEKKLQPRDSAVTLLANRISSDVSIMDAMMELTSKTCIVKVKQKKAKDKTKTEKEMDKYKAYFDFDCAVRYLRDHQVLAIRRGADQKVLSMQFDIDNDRAERIMGGVLKRSHPLYCDAIKDSWSRLLRKRCTTRLWKKYCGIAEERAIDVFCDNLYKSLLAPPAPADAKGVLALDPGFQAGIKSAVLTSSGEVKRLDTIKFLGSPATKEEGKRKLLTLLQQVQNDSKQDNVHVALGNGHGTREARELVTEVLSSSGIPIEVHLVSEAGASVWSVTEGASQEFPTESAAAVASVSIGRRYLNPLHELVKIPPRSLGLGMYQHDLSEKVLDEKLIATSIDSVAEVGVDINSCSREILQKVPSITTSLCDKIIEARPLKSRKDLLKIPGLGSKIYENSAAFIRIANGEEALDNSLVHPESYDLARWILRQLQWELGNPSSVLADDEEQQQKWNCVAKKAQKQFDFTEERILSVIEHLHFSITSPDPRLRKTATNTSSNGIESIGSTTADDCGLLPSEFSNLQALREASLPIRGILATVRNVVDFGSFVDFGGETNGLLHRSKVGREPPQLLVGQEIGVDILGVSQKSDRISVGLHGLNLPKEDLDVKRKRSQQQNKSASSTKRKRIFK
eukprot:CAMPEP_0178929818 /NCGR_PEP_ID=MMETSP0786-20121207/20851_1 /TAXON_ID=186022 /ORGANISM="Thalassionema frauenfeldii, Strain CCMP 1798" /LENGTH=774 /DNA_ID=CAMNT_0020606197 /DNA_START=44 /DNA_END=2368 /DNA_ORIENTATION=+